MKAGTRNQTFGEALRAERQRKNWRPEQLAVLCGVSVSTIGHWEADRKRPRGDHLLLILRELFGWEPPFDTRMKRKDGTLVAA